MNSGGVVIQTEIVEPSVTGATATPTLVQQVAESKELVPTWVWEKLVPVQENAVLIAGGLLLLIAVLIIVRRVSRKKAKKTS